MIQLGKSNSHTPNKPDRREYTLMIVPHHGKAVFSLRIPIRLVKWTGAVVATSILTVCGVMLSYHHTAKVAQAEQIELAKLREINGKQVQQIEQLAKATAALQEDMTRLNALDAELRRMVGSEDNAQTSRSGVIRPGSGQASQGGPVVQPQAEELLSLVNDLQVNAKARAESLTNLREAIVDKKARQASTPSIWPASGDVTSRFGWRSSPWGWSSDWHPGIDIANDWGTPIYAAADGVVTLSDWYGGYGKLVQIDHGNGIVTLYGHNSENLVREGQQIRKGDHIANMGSTGYSTGSHVHYEVRVNGTAVNPANFL